MPNKELIKKLHLKPDMQVSVVNSPSDHEERETRLARISKAIEMLNKGVQSR